MPWGGTRRGSANSWLGNKPRQSGLLSSASPGSGKGRGRGSSSFFEGSSFADEIEQEEEPKPALARQGTFGSTGKGKGRGGAGFFSGSTFDEAEGASPPATSSKPAGKGRGKASMESPAPIKQEPEKRKVPGLEAALAVANLEELKDEAHAWCEHQGAAKLAEIVDFFSDFADALGLRPLQRRRLWSVLAGSAPAPVEVAAPSGYPAAPAPSAPPRGAGAAKLQQAKDALEHAMWGGDAQSLMQAISEAEKAGLEAPDLEEARALLLDDSGPAALSELRRALETGRVDDLTDAIQQACQVGVAESEMLEARAALEKLQRPEPQTAAKPTLAAEKPHLASLRSKLQTAGLSAHIEAVMDWCEENGAAHIEEVAECVEEIAECLGFSDHESRLLKTVFGDSDGTASAIVTSNPVPRAEEPLPNDVAGSEPKETKGTLDKVHQLEAEKPHLAPLRSKLQAAGLSAHTDAVMDWCEENGAAHIDEVAECIDEIAETLGFSDHDRELLETVFEDGGDATKADAPPFAASMPEKAATSSSPTTGISDSQASPRVKGLSAAFCTAGLSQKLQAAAHWCEEAGAATLDEVLENLEDLAEGIELTDQECEALKAALTT